MEQNLSTETTPTLKSPEGNVWYLHLLDIANMSDPSYKLLITLKKAIEKKVTDPTDLQTCKNAFNKEFNSYNIKQQNDINIRNGKPKINSAWDYFGNESLNENVNLHSLVQKVQANPEIIKQMREWVKDCQWNDVDTDEDVDELSDVDIIRGVEKYYGGGVTAFIKDATPTSKTMVGMKEGIDGSVEDYKKKWKDVPNRQTQEYNDFIKRRTEEMMGNGWTKVGAETVAKQQWSKIISDRMSNMEEGVGGDPDKDSKYVKGDRWTVKYGSPSDLKKHGDSEVSPINENVNKQNVIDRTSKILFKRLNYWKFVNTLEKNNGDVLPTIKQLTILAMAPQSSGTLENIFKYLTSSDKRAIYTSLYRLVRDEMHSILDAKHRGFEDEPEDAPADQQNAMGEHISKTELKTIIQELINEFWIDSKRPSVEIATNNDAHGVAGNDNTPVTIRENDSDWNPQPLPKNPQHVAQLIHSLKEGQGIWFCNDTRTGHQGHYEYVEKRIEGDEFVYTVGDGKHKNYLETEEEIDELAQEVARDCKYYSIQSIQGYTKHTPQPDRDSQDVGDYVINGPDKPSWSDIN